jgi:hypothetical protein
MARHMDKLAPSDKAMYLAEMTMARPVDFKRRPHFVIVGAMKSATTTLQEQLVCQPGIFMCTPKEPNFFSNDEQYRKGLSWYQDLFAAAPAGDLLGEASTHYTKLPTYPETLGRMARYLPDVRLIYVMRHPVDRLVSHYMHEWSMGNIDCDIDDAVRRYPEMIAYGRYSMQLAPYFETYGRATVLPVFFDRLTASPQPELERICRFIGYADKPAWREDLSPSNVSQQRLRRFPFYETLVGSAPMKFIRRTFVPRSLRDWVKNRLTMRTRPVLGPSVRASLEATFDEDLATVGAWLGVSLTCANFKSVTAASSLEWSTDND